MEYWRRETGRGEWSVPSVHPPLSQDRYNTMTALRSGVAKTMETVAPNSAFPYSFEFLYWEEVGIIDMELLQNLLICGGVIIVTVVCSPNLAAEGWRNEGPCSRAPLLALAIPPMPVVALLHTRSFHPPLLMWEMQHRAWGCRITKGSACSGFFWGGGNRAPGPHRNTARQAMDGLWTEVCGQQKQSNDPGNNQHILNTPTIGRR